MDTDTIADIARRRSDKLDFNTAGEVTKNKKVNQRPRKQQLIAADDSLKALHRRAEELSKHIEQEPLVDIEKVNAIKAAINAGTYLINANNVADKLMELEFQLTKPPKDS